jgi:hypothetical protein
MEDGDNNTLDTEHNLEDIVNGSKMVLLMDVLKVRKRL